MAAKKKTKRSSKSGGLLAWFTTDAKPKRRTSKSKAVDWKRRMIVFGIIFGWISVGAGLSVGFYYMKQYIQKSGPAATHTGPMELVGPPEWLGQEWLATITNVAGGGRFVLNEQSAAAVGQRLATLSWMHGIRVKTTPETLQVHAEYRRPAARVQLAGGQWVYLDREMVVLDYLPLSAFPIVEIRGFNARSLPEPGSEFRSESAEAAIKLLEILEKMDQKCCPQKPLLGEIEAMDVSNYAGGKSASRPHLVLRAQDGTEIHWGAAYGQSARFLEANEAEKLTKLYNFYRQNGSTLLGKVKYVELRTPQTERPRPQ